MKDPKIAIRELIETNYDKNQTSYDGVPRIHTGWYDRNSGGPQITITNRNESTVNSGQTGITASDNQGGITQVRAGYVLVNCWSGTREELRGEGFGNTDINPKMIADEMQEHVDNIIQDHPDGIINGNEYFNSLGVSSIREVPETEDDFKLRFELQTRYTYQK